MIVYCVVGQVCELLNKYGRVKSTHLYHCFEGVALNRKFYTRNWAEESPCRYRVFLDRLFEPAIRRNDVLKYICFDNKYT